MTQTAVEWLVEQIKDYDFTDPKTNEYLIFKIPLYSFIEKIEQAKEKEKEQIIEARIDGITCAAAFQEMPSKYTTGEQYYNQTYKQISDIVVDAIKSQVTTTGVWTPKTN